MNRPDKRPGAGETALDAATLQIHHPYEPPPGFAAVVPAVHKASTVLFRNAAALRARSWKARDGSLKHIRRCPPKEEVRIRGVAQQCKKKKNNDTA